MLTSNCMCRPYIIDTNNPEGMQLGRFKRTNGQGYSSIPHTLRVGYKKVCTNQTKIKKKVPILGEAFHEILFKLNLLIPPELVDPVSITSGR